MIVSCSTSCSGPRARAVSKPGVNHMTAVWISSQMAYRVANLPIRVRTKVGHGRLTAPIANRPEMVKNNGMRSGSSCSPSAPHAAENGREVSQSTRW